MAWKRSETIGVLLSLLLAMAIFGVFVYLLGGDAVYKASLSGDAAFHVDLQRGKSYELWVLDLNGPEAVQISISNGSCTAFEGTFRLMHPEGDYLPYHPGFSVKESGEYDITVYPLGPGSVQVQIRQETGLNPSRIIHDIQNVI